MREEQLPPWTERILRPAVIGSKVPPALPEAGAPENAPVAEPEQPATGFANVSYDFEHKAGRAIFYGGLGTAAVILAPVALPALGIGVNIASQLSEECCTIVGTNTGLTGAMSETIGGIPVVGTYLNTAGGENILIPAMTVLGGYAAGSLVTRMEEDKGGEDRIGKAIRVSSMGLGVVLAMPAILPGVGHGVQYFSRLVDCDETGKTIAKAIGNTHACTSVASTNGIMGGASVLVGHLPCVMPAMVTAVPGLALKHAENKHREAQMGHGAHA